MVRDKAEREKLDRRQAQEVEDNQAALRRSIEEAQRLLNDSEQMLRRHRREREEDELDEG